MKKLGIILVLYVIIALVVADENESTVRVYTGVVFGVNPPAEAPYVVVVTKMGTALSITLYRDEIPFDSAILQVGESFHEIHVVDEKEDPYFGDIWKLKVLYKDDDLDTKAYMDYLQIYTQSGGYMCAASNCVISGCGLTIDLSKLPGDKQGAFTCDDYRCAWHCTGGQGDVAAYFPPNAGNPYCNENDFVIIYPDTIDMKKSCSGVPFGSGETGISSCCSSGLFAVVLLPIFLKK